MEYIHEVGPFPPRYAPKILIWCTTGADEGVLRPAYLDHDVHFARTSGDNMPLASGLTGDAGDLRYTRERVFPHVHNKNPLWPASFPQYLRATISEGAIGGQQHLGIGGAPGMPRMIVEARIGDPSGDYTGPVGIRAGFNYFYSSGAAGLHVFFAEFPINSAIEVPVTVTMRQAIAAVGSPGTIVRYDDHTLSGTLTFQQGVWTAINNQANDGHRMCDWQTVGSLPTPELGKVAVDAGIVGVILD